MMMQENKIFTENKKTFQSSVQNIYSISQFKHKIVINQLCINPNETLFLIFCHFFHRSEKFDHSFGISVSLKSSVILQTRA